MTSPFPDRRPEVVHPENQKLHALKLRKGYNPLAFFLTLPGPDTPNPAPPASRHAAYNPRGAHSIVNPIASTTRRPKPSAVVQWYKESIRQLVSCLSGHDAGRQTSRAPRLIHHSPHVIRFRQSSNAAIVAPCPAAASLYSIATSARDEREQSMDYGRVVGCDQPPLFISDGKGHRS